MWIARDKDGTLWLFVKNFPYRRSSYWEDYIDLDESKVELDSTLYPNITWENNPEEVQIIPTKALDSLYKIINRYKNID